MPDFNGLQNPPRGWPLKISVLLTNKYLRISGEVYEHFLVVNPSECMPIVYY